MPTAATAKSTTTTTVKTTATAHSTVETAPGHSAPMKTSANSAAMEATDRTAPDASANRSAMEASHRRRMKSGNPGMESARASRHAAVKTRRHTRMEAARHTPVKSAIHAIMKPAGHTGMESTGTGTEPTRTRTEPTSAPMESAIDTRVKSRVKTVMHVKIVADKAAVREKSPVWEKDSAKPARERIEDRRRIKSAVVISRRVIRVTVIAADISHRRSRCRCVSRIIRARIRARRSFGDHRRLAGIRVGLIRRRSHRSRVRFFAQFRAALQHCRQYRRGHTHVTHFDDLIRRRLKRPGRILDKCQNNRLIHSRFGEGNDIIDSTGKLGRSAGRNRAGGGIARLSGIGLHRTREKTGTGDHAAESNKWKKPRFHNPFDVPNWSNIRKFRLVQDTPETPDFQGKTVSTIRAIRHLVQLLRRLLVQLLPPPALLHHALLRFARHFFVMAEFLGMHPSPTRQ
jgi:hypothetical protein